MQPTDSVRHSECRAAQHPVTSRTQDTPHRTVTLPTQHPVTSRTQDTPPRTVTLPAQHPVTSRTQDTPHRTVTLPAQHPVTSRTQDTPHRTVTLSAQTGRPRDSLACCRRPARLTLLFACSVQWTSQVGAVAHFPPQSVCPSHC
jgi:hypothetical protein